MRSSITGNSGYPPAVDERQAELRRERFRNVALRAKAERDEQRAELLAALLLQSHRALDAGGIELSAGNQDFAEAHGSVVGHSLGKPKRDG